MVLGDASANLVETNRPECLKLGQVLEAHLNDDGTESLSVFSIGHGTFEERVSVISESP